MVMMHSCKAADIHVRFVVVIVVGVSGAGVEAGVAPVPRFVGVSSLMETALPFFLWLVHGVLKWLHHPLLKYVMLWHSAESSHNFLHSSMFGSFPGELSMYNSPALASHSILEPTCTHVPRFLGAPVNTG